MKSENTEDKFENLTETEILEVTGGETKFEIQSFVNGAIELYKNLFD